MRELNLARSLHRDPPDGLDRIVSCAEHDGAARQLLISYKFRQHTELKELIGGYMADAAGSIGRSTLIVPIPPARLRTRVRGFDPVALLAEEVSSATGLRLPRSPVLFRKGSGRQRGRDRARRISDPPDLRMSKEADSESLGGEFLLIDDVMTTGATLSAAAQVLRKSGATSVSALTFTRRL